eukprot:SM000024S07846  [mRNA]  locus=s24:834878:839764:- [translate_table: standard]
MDKLGLWAVAVVTAAIAGAGCVRSQEQLRSVPDLTAAMYLGVEGSPCVRLLTLQGELGCANPSRYTVSAPLKHLKSPNETVVDQYAILISGSDFGAFLQRTLLDSTLENNVAGVLVMYDGEDTRQTHSLQGFSPGNTFPLAQFAPYKDKAYPWNPSGLGLVSKRFSFPVHLLDANSTETIVEFAAMNERRSFKRPLYVAEMSFIMQTTKSEINNTAACLASLTCLPLGGYSVFSALPSFPAERVDTQKEVIIAMASVDAASFFRDVAPGADSALALSHCWQLWMPLRVKGSFTSLVSSLAFWFSLKESWGYLGSRQFLAQLTGGNKTLVDFELSNVKQVLEIGSVGRALTEETLTLYTHRQSGQDKLTDEIHSALVAAAEKVANTRVLPASVSNPGLPPSSLMAFLGHRPSLAGVVLEEFDQTFKNPFYHSRFDDEGNINATAITKAATIVARSLHLLAGGTGDAAANIVCNSTLVEELLQCFLSSDPGLLCPLVADYITPSSTRASQYSGVFLGAPSQDPDPAYIHDTIRFAYNFLANKTSAAALETHDGLGSRGDPPTSCSRTSECRQGEVCVAARWNAKGVCMLSSARYIPAHSPRVKHDGSGWLLLESETTMDAVDHVFTESFWSTLTVRAYLQDEKSQDEWILQLGVVVAVLSVLIVASARTIYGKRLKNA